MRERTTWDRTKIANQLRRVAEDPRAMNQDHLQQQPAADAYLIGDGSPSEFAEDVHDESQNWKAEQGGDGNTSRNEIGMPEMRSDTFNHPEKAPGSTPQRGGNRSASTEDQIELVSKKAELCTDIARRMLSKNASASVIEDQALALMDLPDSQLIDTYNRLATDQGSDDDEGDDEEEQQSKEAGQQQQDKESQDQEDEEDEDEGQQSKEAKKSGEIPPQFLENVKKKKEDKDDDKDKDKGQQSKEAGQQQQDKESQDQEQDKEGQDQEQDKEASVMAREAAATLITIPAGPARTAAMKAVASPIFHVLKSKRAQLDQQAMQQLMGQVQQMIQQAMDQQLAQQQQQQPGQQDQMDPMAQQQMLSDDQLLDQMLQDDYDMDGQQQQQMVMAESEIQMDTPHMDVGDVHLGSEDAILSQVFASSNEVQDAMAAASLQGHTTPLGNSQGGTRTASTRTVGTRPSEGVHTLGGSSGSSGEGGNEVSKLANLWSSAPDVSNVFR